MSKLVDKIVANPNSTLNESDRAWLESLAPDALKRLAIGMQSQEVSVTNEVLIDARTADLAAVQQDILDLVATEQEIRRDLEGLGVQSSSVIKQFIPVQNQAGANQTATNRSATMNEQEANDLLDTLLKSKTIAGLILNEAMAARDMNRQKSIDVIVQNSQGMYSEEELRKKFTPELLKLAAFVENTRQTTRQAQLPVFNYDGMGMADSSLSGGGGLAGSRNFGEPLNLPTTWQ